MTDIVSKNKIGIRSGGSLQAKLAAASLLKEQVLPETLDPVKLPNRITIMIDTSGSMEGEPITLLEKALRDFIAKSNHETTSIAVESFPAGVSAPFSNDKLLMWTRFTGLRASGGTPMSEAMNFVLESRRETTRAIIISDGMPDIKPTGATEAFKLREIPVDTIFIGESTTAEQCLKDISEATGGLFCKFSDIKNFSTAFAYLLPETRSDAKKLMLTAGASEVR